MPQISSESMYCAGSDARGPAGLADVADSIKSIAKYGDRFVNAARAVNLRLPNPSVFDEMAVEFERILALARGETADTLQTTLRTNFDGLMSRMHNVTGQFDSVHGAVLRDLRTQAGIVGREAVADEIVRATVARYRWMRVKSTLLAEMGSLGRIISAGGRLAAGDSEPAPAPGGSAAPAP